MSIVTWAVCPLIVIGGDGYLSTEVLGGGSAGPSPAWSRLGLGCRGWGWSVSLDVGLRWGLIVGALLLGLSSFFLRMALRSGCPGYFGWDYPLGFSRRGWCWSSLAGRLLVLQGRIRVLHGVLYLKSDFGGC